MTESNRGFLRRGIGMHTVPLLLGVAVVTGACLGDATYKTTGPTDPEDLTFAPALGVDLSAMTKEDSGLYWQDLVVGTGDSAVPSDQVTVHYTGWLHTGTVFDSSIGGDPVTFSLSEVIAGWTEGVSGMKEGGKRKLVIPPHLAYGASGFGPIPGNATLVFDIELIDIVEP